jgi:hypothetical protein
VKRQRVAPKLGTKVNVGEGPIGGELDVVVFVGPEWGDKVGRVVVESVPQGDKLEEIV